MYVYLPRGIFYFSNKKTRVFVVNYRADTFYYCIFQVFSDEVDSSPGIMKKFTEYYFVPKIFNFFMFGNLTF